MPVSVVKTKADEELWNKAKVEARKTYSEDNPAFWPTVMKIFQRLKTSKKR